MPSKPAFRVLAMVVWLLAPSAMGSDDCGGDPVYSLLDFWMGEWTVSQAGVVVGVNRIEKVLNGCAILEHWRDVEGGEGKSLFYVDAATNNWKQVWVTDRGPMKEKLLILRLADGSVRFQGEVLQPRGSRVLDRTTLTPKEGIVRQVIEISTDQGLTWRTTFDGTYNRKEK